MSILKLDRDRYYAVVYGDPIKKTYQDGVFFNGEGNAIDGSQVKKPAPVAVNEPVQVVEQKDEGNAAKIKELKALSAAKLKKLAKQVNEATGAELPKMNGTGVMARLVKYIADNTSD